MALRSPSVILQLRLDERAHARYEAEAAGARKPLATYLRELLENRLALEARLAGIERAVAEVAVATPAQHANPAKAAGGQQAAAIEALLLLRQLAGPGKSDVAQKELKRRGIDPWS